MKLLLNRYFFFGKIISLACLSLLLLMGCQGDQKKVKVVTTKAPVEQLTFKGHKDLHKGKKVVLVSGDEEYRSEEALPQLAQILSTRHGFDCTVLFAQDPAQPGIIDPNYTKNIAGLSELASADLLILFTRFRELPNEQMQHFQNYLLQGKPLIGIRTATHAFRFQDSSSVWKHWGNYYNGEKADWAGGFGRKILGANWHTHHGHHKHQSTRGLIPAAAAAHPINKGIASGAIWGATDVYGVPLPLPGDAQALMMGQVVNRAGDFAEGDLQFGMRPTDTAVAKSNPASEGYDPNEPMMPIVWSKSYQLSGGKAGQAITSTIGASTDLLNAELRRLFVNATYYLLEMPVPEQAEVGLVGTYAPTPFSFHKDDYWTSKKLKIGEE